MRPGLATTGATHDAVVGRWLENASSQRLVVERLVLGRRLGPRTGRTTRDGSRGAAGGPAGARAPPPTRQPPADETRLRRHAGRRLRRRSQRTCSRRRRCRSSGTTVQWTPTSGVSSYVFARKVPGQPPQYSIVNGTSVDAAGRTPAQTVSYGVRTNVERQHLGGEVSITYPGVRHRVDPRAALDDVGGAGHDLSLERRSRRRQLVCVRAQGARARRRSTRSSAAATRSRRPSCPVRRSTTGVRTNVSGSPWADEVSITYPGRRPAAAGSPTTPTTPQPIDGSFQMGVVGGSAHSYELELPQVARRAARRGSSSASARRRRAWRRRSTPYAQSRHPPAAAGRLRRPPADERRGAEPRQLGRRIRTRRDVLAGQELSGQHGGDAHRVRQRDELQLPVLRQLALDLREAARRRMRSAPATRPTRSARRTRESACSRRATTPSTGPRG